MPQRAATTAHCGIWLTGGSMVFFGPTDYPPRRRILTLALAQLLLWFTTTAHSDRLATPEVSLPAPLLSQQLDELALQHTQLQSKFRFVANSLAWLQNNSPPETTPAFDNNLLQLQHIIRETMFLTGEPVVRLREELNRRVAEHDTLKYEYLNAGHGNTYTLGHYGAVGVGLYGIWQLVNWRPLYCTLALTSAIALTRLINNLQAHYLDSLQENLHATKAHIESLEQSARLRGLGLQQAARSLAQGHGLVMENLASALGGAVISAHQNTKTPGLPVEVQRYFPIPLPAQEIRHPVQTLGSRLASALARPEAFSHLQLTLGPSPPSSAYNSHSYQLVYSQGRYYLHVPDAQHGQMVTRYLVFDTSDAICRYLQVLADLSEARAFGYFQFTPGPL